MHSHEPLLIVGASVRAAVFSALRAGCSPIALDYFGDLDLAAACPATRVDPSEGVAGLLRAAEKIDPCPWLYTGPCENFPEFVDSLSRTHSLCGLPSEGLKRARDPFGLSRVLTRHGFDAPEIRLDSAGLPRDGSWMIKPFASCGGLRVLPWTDFAPPSVERCYFQRIVEGSSFSALFLAAAKRIELLGITRQFHGAPGAPYAYRGSIGPISANETTSMRLRAIGQTLGSEFNLVGLFGIDYVEYEGRPWVLEINPRYTASVEVLELALRRPLLADHLRACAGLDSPLTPNRRPLEGVVGKAILYARRDLIAPSIALDNPRMREPYDVPEIADVPWPGTAFAAGQPILTVFAAAPNPDLCQMRLDQKLIEWSEKLDVPCLNPRDRVSTL
jgi:predicted ATP-grasp superfamily ATP-dependent carboligase